MILPWPWIPSHYLFFDRRGSAKLIEQEAETFLISVPALQGRGLFPEWEGWEAVKADFSFPCYLVQGWPSCVSPTWGA